MPNDRTETTEDREVSSEKLGSKYSSRGVRDRASTPNKSGEYNLPRTFNSSKKFIENIAFDGLVMMLSLAKQNSASTMQRLIEEEIVTRMNSPVGDIDMSLFEEGRKAPVRK